MKIAAIFVCLLIAKATATVLRSLYTEDLCTGKIAYKTINDDGTRHTSYFDIVGNSLDDTNFITPGWYRFFVRGQDATIPTRCISHFMCGTHGTIWIDLKGQFLPAPGEEVKGRACDNWDGDCCMMGVKAPSVVVRNCGSYFIYDLATPLYCDSAYCLE